MAAFEHNSEKFGYLNLDEVDGVQKALSKPGFDPGKRDGADGPTTHWIDGKIGKQTRKTLVDQLSETAK